MANYENTEYWRIQILYVDIFSTMILADHTSFGGTTTLPFVNRKTFRSIRTHSLSFECIDLPSGFDLVVFVLRHFKAVRREVPLVRAQSAQHNGCLPSGQFQYHECYGLVANDVLQTSEWSPQYSEVSWCSVWFFRSCCHVGGGMDLVDRLRSWLSGGMHFCSSQGRMAAFPLTS